jgi:type VI secretion system protein ImpB
MAFESLQKKLNRIRPPRVHITYDVEIGDAIEKRELPLVVCVLADLAGHPAQPLPRLKERKLYRIDLDGFDRVLSFVCPRLVIRVPCRLLNEDGPPSELPVELLFRQLEDFSPGAVAAQVPALKELLSVRDKLNELRAALFGNDRLDGARERRA